jgi:hypothetical protein
MHNLLMRLLGCSCHACGSGFVASRAASCVKLAVAMIVSTYVLNPNMMPPRQLVCVHDTSRLMACQHECWRTTSKTTMKPPRHTQTIVLPFAHMHLKLQTAMLCPASHRARLSVRFFPLIGQLSAASSGSNSRSTLEPARRPSRTKHSEPVTPTHSFGNTR